MSLIKQAPLVATWTDEAHMWSLELLNVTEDYTELLEDDFINFVCNRNKPAVKELR